MIMINGRHFVLHPRGAAFVGTVAEATPSQSELEDRDSLVEALVKLVTNG